MRKRKLGFTIIEVLVVCSIIGILAAIIIPSFMEARQVERLKRKGYSSAYAKAIANFQNTSEGQGRSDDEAYEKIRSDEERTNPPSSGHRKSDQPIQLEAGATSDVSLPYGATDLLLVGQNWYTFRWDGRKYLARVEESRELTTKKVVACLERLD